MTKREIKDRIGRVIDVGMCVAFSHKNELMIGVVTKINPKMVKVRSAFHVPDRWDDGLRNKYGAQCVIIDGPEVTMYLLKEAK